jgi:hypothetical protein
MQGLADKKRAIPEVSVAGFTLGLSVTLRIIQGQTLKPALSETWSCVAVLECNRGEIVDIHNQDIYNNGEI